jgi:predicted nucleotide-binding protein (sugar kinase/HSP70/actin superfamily)
VIAGPLLVGGLGWPYDDFLAAALGHARREGGVLDAGLDVGTIGALDAYAYDRGRASLPRGQCAPALYTAGALLRTASERETRRHAPGTFLALGSCGPCRFSMFDVAWRRALAGAGHTELAVHEVASSIDGLVAAVGRDGAFACLDAILAGDALAEATRRLRPHARDPDDVDRAARRAAVAIAAHLREGHDALEALAATRGWHLEIARATTLGTHARPLARATLVGEPWSVHVDGDPQLNVARVLAHAGVEIDAPPLALWIAYVLWTVRTPAWSTNVVPTAAARETAAALEATFLARFAQAMSAAGLVGYALPSIDELEALAAPHLPSTSRGGYGHVEIGLAMRAARDRRAHLVISVKSFGCIPSSGIGDAILPTALGDLPFLSLEVSHDGAAARESRLGLRVGAAREAARAEWELVRAQRPEASVVELDPLADPWGTTPRPYACTLASLLHEAR